MTTPALNPEELALLSRRLEDFRSSNMLQRNAIIKAATTDVRKLPCNSTPLEQARVKEVRYRQYIYHHANYSDLSYMAESQGLVV